MATRSRAGAALAAPLLLLVACAGQPADREEQATSAVPTQPPAATAESDPPPGTGSQDATTEPNEDAAVVDPTEEPEEPTEESTSTPPPGPVTVTIGATGDILPHAPVIENANLNAGGGADDYDFAPMFDDVRDLLEAPDLALCHLETPISADNTGLTVPRVLIFNSPTQLADGLASAGFDACDFASNHAFDRGVQGLLDTQSVVEDAGMTYAGPPGQASAADQGVVHDVDGIEVAQLVYSYTLLNLGSPNTDVPDGAPWLEQYLWPARGAEGILADAEQARAAGAEFVVVTMHWGNEYQTEPTQQQREIAETLLGSEDVDLILGGHAHVIQPCETINGKFVVYGMGNFLSNQSPDTTRGGLRKATQEGLVLQVELTRESDGTLSSSMVYQPTRVDLAGHVIRLATPGQNAETYQRTVETLNSLGEGSCDAEPMG
jgi:poly-gamma-glutamate synthesis protein (capsule biosynthesis protein)